MAAATFAFAMAKKGMISEQKAEAIDKQLNYLKRKRSELVYRINTLQEEKSEAAKKLAILKSQAKTDNILQLRADHLGDLLTHCQKELANM